MAKIKTTRKKVMFNMSERELCSKCGYPKGFCKHTIQKEYQELCPNTPLKEESIWQLVRSHAICETEKRNIWDCLSKQVRELENDNFQLRTKNQELIYFKKHILRTKNQELIYFKKHMEDILLNIVKSNVQTK